MRFIERHIIIAPIVILFILTSFTTWATEYYSNGTGGGDWSTAGTWIPAGPPSCGDTIYIQDGDVVTVSGVEDYTACGQPMFLEVYGTLDFSSGGAKLRLPGGSGIAVYDPNGVIQASGTGGGNSKNIQIGATVVWNGTQPAVTGGESFGTPLSLGMLYFTGEQIEKGTELTWYVENNFEGKFLIDKSADGLNWVNVGFVIAEKGANAEFSFIDFDQDLSYVFYKLSFLSLDGNLEELSTIVVLKDVVKSFEFNVIPNPTDRNVIELVASSQEDQTVYVTLCDLNGSVVYSGELMLMTGSHKYAVSSKLNENGFYFIRLNTISHSRSEKVVIAN